MNADTFLVTLYLMIQAKNKSVVGTSNSNYVQEIQEVPVLMPN
jgi:hypothetical protein